MKNSVEVSMLMFSIKPKWVEMIFQGVKTYELRRRPPPSTAIGKIALIYSTAPTSAVVARCVVADIISNDKEVLWELVGHAAGCSKQEYSDYFDGCDRAHAIKLSLLEIRVSSLPLTTLRGVYGIRPPQSWRWVHGNEILLENSD